MIFAWKQDEKGRNIMIVKNNLSLGYDLSDNVIITIPKSYIRNIEQNILLKSIEKLIESATRKINRSEGWIGDSAADIAGVGKSGVKDGSVHHDRYIYGLE
jgi:hypothetical protein